MAIVKRNPAIGCAAIAHQKIISLTLAGWRKKSEVSLLGVTADEEHLAAINQNRSREVDFYLLDFFPVKQEGNSTYTQMDDIAVIELGQRLVEQGHKRQNHNAHAHSHPDMSTTPSGTDENHIEEYDPDVALITIIMNEKYALTRDRKGLNVRLDIWYPFRRTFKDGEVDFIVDDVQVIPDSWGDDAFEEFVTKKIRVVQKLNIQHNKYTHRWTPDHALDTPGYGLGYRPSYNGYHSNSAGNLGRATAPSVKVGNSLKNREHLNLTHPELQKAYDDCQISREAAEELELKWVNDSDYQDPELLCDLDHAIEKQAYKDDWWDEDDMTIDPLVTPKESNK